MGGQVCVSELFYIATVVSFLCHVGKEHSWIFVIFHPTYLHAERSALCVILSNRKCDDTYDRIMSLKKRHKTILSQHCRTL
jgi:hypothetical protein